MIIEAGDSAVTVAAGDVQPGQLVADLEAGRLDLPVSLAGDHLGQLLQRASSGERGQLVTWHELLQIHNGSLRLPSAVPARGWRPDLAGFWSRPTGTVVPETGTRDLYPAHFRGF